MPYDPTQLTHWRAALAGAPLPVHENDPQPGYYRIRASRGGPWLPVAIWQDSDGQLKALRDGREADPQDLWTWCCRNPVPYEVYRGVAEEGQAWPDDVGVGLGHNRGPALDGTDELSAVAAEITALSSNAEAWLAEHGTIATQGEADRAANYAERFGALEKRAEEARVNEKKPILEAGRAIDAAWKPVVDAAASGKKRMKKALEPFLIAEECRLAQEADRNGGGLALAARAGTSGRRVGLRRERRLVVRDRDALIRAYRRDPRFWAHAGTNAVLVDLAEADLRAGRKVAGAELVDTHIAA
jgi:hypothetical protein